MTDAALARVLATSRDLVRQIEALARDPAPPTPPPSPPEPAPAPASTRRRLAWGARVSPTFRDRVFWLADDLGMDPDDLMTCMAWESGRSFRPDIQNMAGSGATGLIQFMPSTAIAYFHTPAEVRAMSADQKRAAGIAACRRLAAMTAEDQLNYVWRYFEPYDGRLKTLGDIYMAILWPAGVGKPDSYVLWEKGARPTTYRQNAGLDVDRDGRITRAETVAKVAALKTEGLRPGNVWEG